MISRTKMNNYIPPDGNARKAAFNSVLLCLLFFGIVCVRDSLAQSNYTIPRQIQYSFTLRNKTNRLIEKAEFLTYAPVKATSTQRCVKIETSHPYELISDELGNQILRFSFEKIPPYAVRIVHIKANLLLSEQPEPISVDSIDRFLCPERFIESDSPEIRRLANILTKSDQSKTAESAFNWVSENVKYSGYLRNDHGALYALRNKRGDCTESMYLFTALCRANHIPAQGIGGYVCPENTVLRPEDYHNWAEFYQDGAWRIADPQKKTFTQNQSDYIAMKIMGTPADNPMGEFERFRSVGEGLDIVMND